MAQRTFINLPVRDLGKSMDFFKGIGFKFNDQFTDEKAGCMIISDTLSVMLLTEGYFRTFTKKPVSDAKTVTEVLIALEVSSKEEVIQKISKAQSLGAEIYANPQDHGWMYQHSFADPDGHQWELTWVDESQLPG
ncbi:VOC family protein [Sinomicrobium weinanense]|uniref:VOC family protein n=1 Tax=Sinomicrobium weinanense TaxID=2842200 RepID=A0A926JWM9_9FLAO|nr:VOC family protein [Sinomicrobium weinanense]MBC9798543.1 VOC family protein [Sinomicrobium weinanense]MBU3122540.1 VOC family protein [Sinomicrobium weinanense]